MIYSLISLFLLTAGIGATPQVELAPEKKPDDLATKLIRKTIDDSAVEDPMGQMAEDMTEIARRLQVDFDAGEQTQAQQRQVSTKLDEAIKAAAARRRMQSKPDPKQHSDKRTMPTPKRTPGKPAPQAKQTAQGKAKDSTEKTDDSAALTKEEKKSDAAGVRRAWGNLPQRDREEVLQGAEEESLERFRQWIDQYFKALQETNR